MPDELLARLRRFHDPTFPGVQEQFQNLVKEGQHPTTVHWLLGFARAAISLDRGRSGRVVFCGRIRAFYEEIDSRAKNLAAWLELGREAALPVQVTLVMQGR